MTFLQLCNHRAFCAQHNHWLWCLVECWRHSRFAGTTGSRSWWGVVPLSFIQYFSFRNSSLIINEFANSPLVCSSPRGHRLLSRVRRSTIPRGIRQTHGSVRSTHDIWKARRTSHETMENQEFPYGIRQALFQLWWCNVILFTIVLSSPRYMH